MKTYIVYISLCLLFFFPLMMTAQSKGSSYKQQTQNLIIYNVSSTALISGFGAIITRDKNDKWIKSFLKGFAYGGIGGYCMYQSKNMLNKVSKKEDISYYWPSKLLFGVGESISENASANRPPWLRWHVNLWLSRVDFDFQNEFKIRGQLDLIQSTFVIREFFKKRRLDIPLSLKSGILIFDANGNGMPKIKNGDYAAGYASAGYIVIDNQGIDALYQNVTQRNKFKHEVYSHEMVHTFQFNNYNGLNGYFQIDDDMNIKNWGFIYPSRQLFSIFYLIEGNHEPKKYFRNFFEFEAEYFATKRQVNIE